ncbi:SAV_6107 family HEPN domain-containing protein [Longivirga aurantiaca]
MTATAETRPRPDLEVGLTPVPPDALPATPVPSVPAASRDLLAGAARELLAAGSTDDTGLRYARAHLSALRAAAAVLAARARPRGKRSARLRSAWVLLAEVAPELGEWAQFFAAGAGKRAAAEAGLRGVVSEREADDLVRDAEAFLARVARLLGVPHQPLLGGPSAAVS